MAKKKKDRIPKELLLFLSGSVALVAAGAVYIMTRKTTPAAVTPATPKLPQNNLPPPPPGSYNASIPSIAPLNINQLIR